MKYKDDINWWAWVFGISAVILVLFSAFPAKPHEWYPVDCCHGQDCAPATVTKIGPNSAEP